MLGIYAAHLLTLSPEPDKTLLHEMADNLRQLVGDHPDVMSLYLWLDPKAKVPPFSTPPILRNSWDIVVDSSFDRPDLVPPGSYGSRIATRLWGSGVWLTWRVPDRLSWSASPATSTELNSFFDLFLKRDGAAAAFSRAAEALQSEETLGEAERRLLAYVGGIVKGGSSAGRFAWDGTGSGLRGAVRSIIVTMIIPWIKRQTRNAAKNILKPESIIRALGMPEATLAQTAGDLLAKFNALLLLPVERRGARTAADVLAEEFVALRPDGRLEDQTLEGIYRSVHNLSSDQAALCLAGDGLRGAFFDLGVLEGLARYGLLGKFHYLSTVSGGSYIGAWLSAWRHHAEDEAAVLSAIAAGPSESMQNPVGRPVVQLSEVNDFLMARRGVLSFGMWTRCGAYARNLLLIWLVYGPLFLTFLMVPKIYLALVVFAWKAPVIARMMAFGAATIFLFYALTVREFRKIASLAGRGAGWLHPKKEVLVPLSLSGALFCAAAPLWDREWASLLIGAGAAGAVLFVVSWILSHSVTGYRALPPTLLRWCGWMLAGAAGGLLFAGAFSDLSSILFSLEDARDTPVRALAIAGVALMVLATVVADVIYLGLISRLPGGRRDHAWQAASAGVSQRRRLSGLSLPQSTFSARRSLAIGHLLLSQSAEFLEQSAGFLALWQWPSALAPWRHQHGAE
jgi:hypothetical protein